MTASSGPRLKDVRSSRGSAVGDLDNDGSLEIVISNMGERPTLLKNFAPRKNWLLVQCVGRSDIDAIGARVRVQVAGRWLHAEVLGGSSYLSQSDPRLHFGLGDSAILRRHRGPLANRRTRAIPRRCCESQRRTQAGHRTMTRAGGGIRRASDQQCVSRRVGQPDRSSIFRTSLFISRWASRWRSSACARGLQRGGVTKPSAAAVGTGL